MKNILTVVRFVAFFCTTLAHQSQMTMAQNAPAIKTANVATQNNKALPAQIVATTKKAQFEGSDNVFIDVAFENTGAETLTLRAPLPQHFYQIEVNGPRGKAQALPLSKRIYMSSDMFVLAPKTSKKGYIWLNRLFDISYTGKYTVTLSTQIPNGKEALTITSQPIIFEVISAPSPSGWDNP